MIYLLEAPLSTYLNLPIPNSHRPPLVQMILVSLAALLWVAGSQCIAAELHVPAVLVTSNTTLKPLLGKNNGGSPIDAYFITNPLNRLLFERQSSCPGGYGQCSNEPDKCCLLSTSCCANNNSKHPASASGKAFSSTLFRMLPFR